MPNVDMIPSETEEVSDAESTVSAPLSHEPAQASLDPLHDLAAVQPSRSDLELHTARAQRRLRKAPFTRSHYSAHGQVRSADFPDYSLPLDDLRRQSMAIGGLEIHHPRAGELPTSPTSVRGRHEEALSISMPVRMGGRYLPLREYATLDEGEIAGPSGRRISIPYTESGASVATTTQCRDESKAAGRAAWQRRPSRGDSWWQLPNILPFTSERPTYSVDRLGGSLGTYDGMPGWSESDAEGADAEDTEAEIEADMHDDTDADRYTVDIDMPERNPLLDAQLGYTGYNAISLPWRANGAGAKLEQGPHLVRALMASAPAVIVSTLINVLSAVSYGMIIFPLALSVFSDFALDGVAMFLISTIISQVVYAAGGSAFPGAVGGMILEVAPFLHAIAFRIVEVVGDKDPLAVTATTIVAYAVSALVTGVFFLLLGYFKLGSLIGFFPRHILVGCIGGVGWFLVVTAVEVASGVNLERDAWSHLLESRALPLWSTGLALAVLLQLLLNRTRHPLTIPLFLLGVPLVFYIIAAILHVDQQQLTESGWLFNLPTPLRPFYQVYQRFDFGSVVWSAIPSAVPGMLVLSFFSVLHVPINVPALSVTIAQDKVDLNRELLAHGASNILSGLFGSVQNYLVYSNSVLFIRCGGNNRVAGMALAIGTLLAFFAGPGLIVYIPVVVVASLIFHLGIELMKEAIYHPWGRVHPLEYATIIAIVLSMATIGFIEGVLVGAVLACLFFVVLYSRRQIVRRWKRGGPGGVRSALRRPIRQRQYLDQLGEQIHLLELQGFLFFGTVNALEDLVESIVAGSRPDGRPTVRFIVMDFSLVTGVDFSAAEALVRVKRTLAAHDVCLVVAGAVSNSDIGQALQSVGVWGGTRLDVYIQNARTAQQAIEWCENQLLKCYYDHSEELEAWVRVDTEPVGELSPGQMTPRTEMIAQAAHALVPDNILLGLPDSTDVTAESSEPYALLRTALSRDLTLSTADTNNHVELHDASIERQEELDALRDISSYCRRMSVARGHTLWRAGETPRALYLLEAGTLVLLATDDPDSALAGHSSITTDAAAAFTTDSTVQPDVPAFSIRETILPGALAGGHGLVTSTPSPYHLIADTDVVVWRLSLTTYRKLCKQKPNTALWLVSALMALHTTA